jgi:hypothetical protein
VAFSGISHEQGLDFQSRTQNFFDEVRAFEPERWLLAIRAVRTAHEGGAKTLQPAVVATGQSLAFRAMRRITHHFQPSKAASRGKAGCLGAAARWNFAVAERKRGGAGNRRRARGVVEAQ